MRVQYQPSGGRGEYELSDAHNEISPPDLLDLELHADWGPFGVRQTGLSLAQSETQGKYRLRVVAGKAAHFQIQLATGLLLPHPIREEDRLEGGPVLMLARNYLVNRVELTSVTKMPDRAEIRFGGIETKNGTSSDILDFNERLTRVVLLHERRHRLPEELKEWLHAHEELLQTNRPITRRDEGIVRNVMSEVEDVAPDYELPYIPGTDPLPVLERMVADDDRPPDPLEGISIDSIPEDELELRRRLASRAKRMVAVRGAKSVKFRRDVTGAYRFRCIVCGLRYPKSKHCSIAGVDAAHILPWRDVDLDEICNGMCLCKIHHWAFDQQLISIRWDTQAEKYLIEVTERARKALETDADSLGSLLVLEKTIPSEWLPRKRDEWPHPKLLAKLLEDLPPVA